VRCDTSPSNPACDDPHTEPEQAAYYNALLALSEAHGVAGFLFWSLSDFSYIQPGAQRSHYCQGIFRHAAVAFCDVAGADYSWKPAADVVWRHFLRRTAYLDRFDGWVDPRTDLPPPGWRDNWAEGGLLMRGYDDSKLLWSHTPGHVALAKFVADGTLIVGRALSPELTQVNVDQSPMLIVQVAGYEVRDQLNGSDAVLRIGVQEGQQVTLLRTISPSAPLPASISIDLRQAPLRWSGEHTFRIVFELAPVGADDGYSATYELDEVCVMATPRLCLYHVFLPMVMK
jgi:hypothetical protein